MSKPKTIAIILVVIFVLLLIQSFVFGSLVNLIWPPEASFSDKVVEDIGGDNFLVATLGGCLKLNEENIPDAKFNTSSGEFEWFGAKNISYVNTVGEKEYIVVWKTTPDKYGVFNASEDVNQYVSAELTDRKARCFIEYSFENNCVYGIVLGTDTIYHSEAGLVYDILGLSRDSFSLTSSPQSSGFSTGYSAPTSHYHTVVGDRYSLSRSDPGAYYDHYEYGDNYDIDDYLEVEGYD